MVSLKSIQIVVIFVILSLFCCINAEITNTDANLSLNKGRNDGGEAIE